MKRTTHVGLAVAMAAASLLALPASVGAQQDESSPSLIGEVQLFGEQDVTIEAATKSEIPISQAPGSVTVITAKQIRESNARTIPELLRLVAGVNVRWNPMVQSIDIRGFGQTPFTSRVLMLIDGVPYNSWNKGGFPQHPGFDFFVLQNVKRIEVVRGPNSALYGENAYWGVINIVTLSGEDLQGGQVELYGGDARNTASVGGYYGAKIGEGSVFVSGKFLQSQIPIAFWSEHNDSKVDGSDIFVKAVRKGIQLSYYRHQDSLEGFEEVFPAEAGLPPGAAFRSASEVGQTIQIAALKFDHNPKDTAVSVSGNLSYAKRNGSHCGACHARTQRTEFDSQANHGYQLLGDVKFGFHKIPGNDLLIGVEARKTDTGDHQEELSIGRANEHAASEAHTVLGPGSYSKLAFYAQDQISLGDRVRFILGARYDADTDLFDSAWSPRVSAVFNPTERLSLRAGWSKAFRFPNYSELYQDTWFINAEDTPFGTLPMAVFRPNAVLEPERNESFEAGAELRFNSNVSAKVDLYRTRVEDFIVLGFLFEPPPGVPAFQAQNHPDVGIVKGAEFELRWNVPGRITGYASWAVQTQEQEGNLVDGGGLPLEFVYAPKNKVNFGAYAGPFAGLSLAAEVQWRDERVGPSVWYLVRSNFTDPTITPLESYTMANARLSYDLPFDMNGKPRPMRLIFYGRNLLDERPEETLTGVDMRVAGREFFGGLSFTF